MDKRIDREVEIREETDMRTRTWAPPSLLPEFKKQPGWAYRWIRVTLANEPDARNASSKMREGWEPVKHSEHPEIKLTSNPNSQFKDAVEVGGLILCKMPQEMVDQRTAYYKKKTEGQAQAVDNSFLKENDPRMPLFSDKKSTKSFGKG
jgi:hypothetical protein